MDIFFTVVRIALNLRYVFGTGLLPKRLKEAIQEVVHREGAEIAVYSDHDGPISPEASDYFNLRPSRWILGVMVLLRTLGVRTGIVTGRSLRTILQYQVYRPAIEAIVGALGYEYCPDLAAGTVQNKEVDPEITAAFEHMLTEVRAAVEAGHYKGFGVDVRGHIAGLNMFVSNVQGGKERQAALFAAIEAIVDRHFLPGKMDRFLHRVYEDAQPRVDVHIAGLTRTGKGEEVKALYKEVHESSLVIVVADDVEPLLESLKAGAHEVMDPKGGSIFAIEVNGKRVTFQRRDAEHLVVPGQVGYFLVLWQMYGYIRRQRRIKNPKTLL